MRKIKILSCLSCLVIISGFLLPGCVKSSPPPTVPQATYISVMHLAPTAPALDVYFNDSKVSTNPFTPGSVSGAYNAIDPANISVKFKKTGGDSLVASLSSEKYDSLHFYTIMVFNLQANGPAQAIRIEDDFSNVLNNQPY